MSALVVGLPVERTEHDLGARRSVPNSNNKIAWLNAGTHSFGIELISTLNYR
ncbi:hypothetical protein BRPE64_ACDS17430 [Caballeronia insecticola]|uniref:Uncharacterized protein n=1 Tax=Caballeronia insecticola TaxID=758793 RepID=R4WYV8_9BURK|nr:hypothetical protein BRPE64_ACDS17430 [Caballeronia insecticola]